MRITAYPKYCMVNIFHYESKDDIEDLKKWISEQTSCEWSEWIHIADDTVSCWDSDVEDDKELIDGSYIVFDWEGYNHVERDINSLYEMYEIIEKN